MLRSSLRMPIEIKKNSELLYTIGLFNKVSMVCLTIGLLLVVWPACKQSNETKVKDTITALQNLQQLATVEYSMSKVVKASDDGTWFKIGDRKILITCEAYVKAGIDLSQIDVKHVSIEGKSIFLQLPRAKVLSLRIPPEEVKVAYEEVGFFRDRFDVAEQNNLMQQAERQIQKQLQSINIEEEAEKNARLYLTGLLSAMGYTTIDISFTNQVNILPPK